MGMGNRPSWMNERMGEPNNAVDKLDGAVNNFLGLHSDSQIAAAITAPENVAASYKVNEIVPKAVTNGALSSPVDSKWITNGRTLYLVDANSNFKFTIFNSEIMSKFAIIFFVLMIIAPAAILPLSSFALVLMYALRFKRFMQAENILEVHYPKTVIKDSVKATAHHLNMARASGDETYASIVKEYLGAAQYLRIGTFNSLNPSASPFYVGTDAFINGGIIANDLAEKGQHSENTFTNTLNNFQSINIGVFGSPAPISAPLRKMGVARDSLGLPPGKSIHQVANEEGNLVPVSGGEQDAEFFAHLCAEDSRLSRLEALMENGEALSAEQLQRLEACFNNLEESYALLGEARKENPKVVSKDLPEQALFDELVEGVVRAVQQIEKEIRDGRLQRMQGVNNFIKQKFGEPNSLSLRKE